MTLIILLMVLLVERVGLQSSTWQITTYVSKYSKWFAPKVQDQEPLSLFIFTVAPAVSIGVFLVLLDSRFIEFLLGLFILAVSVGYYPVRALYRQYLNAKQRGDEEAAAIIHFKLRGEPNEEEQVETFIQKATDDVSRANENIPDEEKQSPTIGETLIWLNLQYYAAPIFYYVIFGIPGVIFYSTILCLVNNGTPELLADKGYKLTLAKWREWLLWLPARFVSLGYMFVGHFGNGLDAWLKLAGNLSNSSFQVVTQVALAAEGIKRVENVNNAEPMVRLAKRNMVLFIVVVALLTLYGKVV